MVIKWHFSQVGGATGIVGDPSGRIKEREEFPVEALARNVAGLTENLQRVFENEVEATERERKEVAPLK